MYQYPQVPEASFTDLVEGMAIGVDAWIRAYLAAARAAGVKGIAP